MRTSRDGGPKYLVVGAGLKNVLLAKSTLVPRGHPPFPNPPPCSFLVLGYSVSGGREGSSKNKSTQFNQRREKAGSKNPAFFIKIAPEKVSPPKLENN